MHEGMKTGLKDGIAANDLMYSLCEFEYLVQLYKRLLNLLSLYLYKEQARLLPIKSPCHEEEPIDTHATLSQMTRTLLTG